MIAIFGSGFGLYGYLPALVACGQRIVLPERYRGKFCGRPELACFTGEVTWGLDDAAVLESAEGAVLALRPTDQSEWISRCLVRPNIERLILEKPLAHSPDVAQVALDHLIRSGRAFRIGYTFRYTAWGKQMLSSLRSAGGGALSIQWDFLAHHFRHDLCNWKRFNTNGGGAIRFYGIHIIALLAEFGYRDVTLSQAFGVSSDEIEKWSAVFTGSGLPECEVQIDTRSSISKFCVEQFPVPASGGLDSIVFADLNDPFDLGNKPSPFTRIDPRIPVLSQLCSSLWGAENHYEWYDATIRLWRKVEKKTQFEVLGAGGRNCRNPQREQGSIVDG